LATTRSAAGFSTAIFFRRYVRSGDLVRNLIRGWENLKEYAFAR
jgi:hypothetical protein